MKSKTSTSINPRWSGRRKCLPTVVSTFCFAASDGINNIVCFTIDVRLCLILFVCDRSGDRSRFVELGAIPASGVVAEVGGVWSRSDLWIDIGCGTRVGGTIQHDACSD
jgi:hypothetical protein